MKAEALSYSVCLLRCADDTICTTLTDKEPGECVAQHNAGRGKPYTRGRLPVSLAAAIKAGGDPYEALGIAWAIRQLSRKAKEKLCCDCEEVLQAVVARGRRMGRDIRRAREG